MRTLHSRDELPNLLIDCGLTGVGVEVGTYRGDYAAHLLAYWPGTLHCVDPWRSQPDWVDLLSTNQSQQDANYDATRECLAPYGDRAVIHRATSDDAVHVLAPLAPFDFVYIDARHDAPHPLDDITRWAPLIRPGGLLCGHDYLPDGTYATGVYAVKGAVDGWMAANGYPKHALHVTTGDPYPSWMLKLAYPV